MKRLVIFLSLLLLPLAALSGRELRKEWAEYQRLARKDRPVEQIEKLHQIREIALARRLPDDLLEACEKEMRVYSRKNWKGIDSLRQALTEVIESYGQPMLTFRWLDYDWAYAKAHQEELGRRRHPKLQPHRIFFLQTGDFDDVLDDFEWILWHRLTNMTSLGPDSEEYRLLDERIGDHYPNRPYLSYLMASRAEDPLPALQAVLQKYADTPFRLVLEEKIMWKQWEKLRDDETATEADYKKFYEEVELLRKALRADRSDISKRWHLSVDGIRNNLTASSLYIRFQEDSVVLTGRNFGRGTLTFDAEGVRRNVSFRNREGRFYVQDTVKARIPDLPDGTYRVSSSSNNGAVSYYEKHTLSLAVREQGKDYAIYVTDYMTGEPASSAVVRLKYGNGLRRVLEREIPLSGQGFTPLPADFRKNFRSENIRRH